MLEVVFYRDGSNRPSSIVARGHVDSAEHGKDIVCAAVSAILQAARLGLERHARVELEADQQPGTLRLRWPERVRDREDVRAIVETAALSVEQIAHQFPGHVTVRQERTPPHTKE